ncbi:MAG: pantetheine-phosphate adenylyltransferase [Candidatus Limiplasma sp.]|nr:pantetheine-phosphate adenylyltransferase [Candidatus Limiplasma sp.]
MKTAVYPGSFDPVTIGHVDIIRRGSRLFDRLVVAVLHNPSKKGCFSIDQRLDFLRRSCEEIPNVRFDAFDGLLADYMRAVRADCVLRGLRSGVDLESEAPMAQLNRTLLPGLETVFLPADPHYACVSSSAVREIGSFGGDLTPFVPACIAGDVARALISKP